MQQVLCDYKLVSERVKGYIKALTWNFQVFKMFSKSILPS